MNKAQYAKVKKAFALSSIIGAALKSSNNGNPKLTTLTLQVNKAMRVFNVKAPMEYYRISEDIKTIWEDMVTRHNNTLDEDEMTVFLEMLLNLSPRSDMKKFLGTHFTSAEKLRDEKKSAILMSVLDLDEALNKLFGTDQTATRSSLAKVMVKPIKIKATKKIRDKALPASTKRFRNKMEYRKKRVRNGQS